MRRKLGTGLPASLLVWCDREPLPVVRSCGSAVMSIMDSAHRLMRLYWRKAASEWLPRQRSDTALQRRDAAPMRVVVVRPGPEP